MKSKKILIVDDSKFDRELVINALESKLSFEFLEASQGEQCLEYIKEEKIDLVLMDIMMPGDFGNSLLVKIRKKLNPIELPIIMITSRSDTKDIIDCLQKGANDYITKPVNFEIAESRIQTHLKLAEISESFAKMKKMEALNAIITTYNHEINNPLSIVLGLLKKASWEDPEDGEAANAAFWRIAEIVKNISIITEKEDVNYEDYALGSKLISLK